MDPRTEPLLPYARQSIDEDDVAAVSAVLRSDWLTTGPAVEVFERDLAKFVGARHGVAVSSGTAALHAAMHALGVGPGDEVIVPVMTFVATANAVVFQGARPVFVDVCSDTLLVDPAEVEDKITDRTKAVVVVDFAGQPCEYDELTRITRPRRVPIIADACHALGARLGERPVGSIADLSAFSFHPVKHVATAEGGMVTTDDDELANRMRRFRNHGISRDFRERAGAGSWEYEMVDLGFNYRLSDVHCALGSSQLRKLPSWLQRRNELADRYESGLATVRGASPLARCEGVSHAFHLYVIKLDEGVSRAQVFATMRDRGIGVNVHYLPVHLHGFYRERFCTKEGHFPVAEEAYYRILSLPMFPAMRDADLDRVIESLREAIP